MGLMQTGKDGTHCELLRGFQLLQLDTINIIKYKRIKFWEVRNLYWVPVGE